MAELELNRLRKQGHGLVLEEHSSCEVPAGCGGVVLRWVRAEDPAELDVRHLAPSSARLLIDGAEPDRERVILAPGPHVVCFEFDAAASGALLATLKIARRQVLRPELHTASDGQWRSTWLEPDPRWTALEFDAAGWDPMVEVGLPSPADRTQAWQVDFFSRSGARAVAPARPTLEKTILRVRRRFQLTSEGLS